MIPKEGWKATVIVPTKNEAENLPDSLPAIKHWRDNHPNRDNIRLLLVNDGSTDSTVEDARRMGFEVIPSHTTGKSQGKTLAVKRGVEHAAKNGSHAVILLDADLVQPEGTKIEGMLQPVLKGEHDMVIGIQGEGMYDVSTTESGQRAIAMHALQPWLEGHEDWQFDDPWALEAMLNENIPRKHIREPIGRGDSLDFHARKAHRQSSDMEQYEQRAHVYHTLRKRREARRHK
jgi:glycosyltransferase involved in cell wall biosynthesis